MISNLLQSSIAVGVLSGAVLAQTEGPATTSFDFDDFSDVSALTLNGSAAQSTDRLRLINFTPGGLTSSTFFSTPVDISAGFDTTFEFIWNPGNEEGFAFVIQNDPRGASALGGGTYGLGYGFGQGSGGAPIENGLVLEFDAERQGFLSDTSGFETSLHAQGSLALTENELSSIGRAGSPVTPNAAPRTVRVRYVPGLLEVFIDGAATPRIVSDFDHRSGASLLAGGSTGAMDVPGGQAFVGFTAANGSASGQTVDLLNWEFDSLIPPPACANGSVLNAGSPFDVLRINGTIGDFFRDVELPAADPWTLTIDPPPGLAAAPVLLLASLGEFDGTMTMPLGSGELCFTNFGVLDIGAAMAPASLPIPPGIAFGVPLSFQGLMATNPGMPNQFDVTNAITVDFFAVPPPTIGSFSPTTVSAGEIVTVNGSNFSEFATVQIGAIFITPTVVTGNMLQFVAPPGLPCDGVLSVINPDGNSGSAPTDINPSPVITGPPGSGPASGGVFFLIIGEGFSTQSTVTVGGNPATIVSAQPTGILVSSPPGTPGPAQVVVTNPNTCFAVSTYTYF
ncbi:MAG: IPT/TIG domain-containing protein [Planctomycetota bacterium]